MDEDSTRLISQVDTWWMITLGFCIAVNVVAPGLIIGRLWYVVFINKTVAQESCLIDWPS